jgi:hypothetical protein
MDQSAPFPYKEESVRFKTDSTRPPPPSLVKGKSTQLKRTYVGRRPATKSQTYGKDGKALGSDVESGVRNEKVQREFRGFLLSSKHLNQMCKLRIPARVFKRNLNISTHTPSHPNQACQSL